jgi:hypothetical protein
MLNVVPAENARFVLAKPLHLGSELIGHQDVVPVLERYKLSPTSGESSV